MTHTFLWRGKGRRSLLSLQSNGPICQEPWMSTSGVVSMEFWSPCGSSQWTRWMSPWEFTALLPPDWKGGLEGSFGFQLLHSLPFNRWGISGHREVTDLCQVTQQVKDGFSPESMSPYASLLLILPQPAPLCCTVHCFLLSCEDFLNLWISNTHLWSGVITFSSMRLRVEMHNRWK